MITFEHTIDTETVKEICQLGATGKDFDRWILRARDEKCKIVKRYRNDATGKDVWVLSPVGE